MPTAAKARPTRKTKPAAVRRTEWLKVRASPVEKATIEARAQEAGIGVSEHLRQRGSEPVSGVGTRGSGASQPRGQGRGEMSPSGSTDSGDGPVSDLEARIEVKMRSNGIGKRSAEILVKRDMARERAEAV